MSHVSKLLSNKKLFPILRIAGYGLFAYYLLSYRDFSFSLPWALGSMAINLFVAISLATIGAKCFPRLDRLHSWRKAVVPPAPLSQEEWQKQYDEWKVKQREYEKKQDEFYLSQFRLRNVAYAPSEDGLLCVPILLIGLSASSAILAGVVFGFLHLRNHTYLDCIGKAITYSVICLIVLPHGLLTVAAGHTINNALASTVGRIVTKKVATERQIARDV